MINEQLVKLGLATLWCAALLIFPVGSTAGRPVLSREQKVEHALARLTFGARPGDAERVAKIGVDAFINEQLDPYSIDDSALDKKLEKLPTLYLSTPILAEQYNPPKPSPTPMASPTPADATPTPVPSPTATPKPTPTPKNPQMVINELQRAKLLRAVYSNRQLYELVVDFWENHFSIYGNKDATRWTMTAFDRDAVRPYAMGRFRDLLGATAKSPAMLYYLDNWQSSLLREYPATKDKPARKTGGINENYARELLELHTMGVDGGYSQKDVQEVARCFTGWSIRKPNEEGLFVYNPGNHDNGEKTVLGVKIPAGGGIADGERVLDILAKHPKTARFIATKLARRFLGDNPPQIVVERAAKAFLASEGSITETLRSILTSPQFFAVSTYRNKVKSPFEFVVSALRATGAETDGQRPVLDWVARMGQPVYGRLTPDGYPDMSAEWLSNNDLLARFNFSSALGLGGIKGTSVNSLSFGDLDSPTKRTAAARQILGEGVSAKTLAGLQALKIETAAPATIIPAAAKRDDGTSARKALGGQIVALLLGSPEFQRK
jgi:uncharacterized protein (DUF1800 family)